MYPFSHHLDSKCARSRLMLNLFEELRQVVIRSWVVDLSGYYFPERFVIFEAIIMKNRVSNRIGCGIILFLLFFSGTNSLLAQEKKSLKPDKTSTDTTEDYFNDNFIRYDNHIYKKNIKTVQLNNKAAEMSSPFIRLGSDDQLKLGFDDLEAGFKTYTYTIIHCNADWQPSDLVFNEYVNGFTENPVNDYRYSTGLTLQTYTHYQLYFPNENLIILKSGNYILKVYQDNDPDNLVLTRRFMVYENLVGMAASFKTGGGLTDKMSKQGINFTLQYNNQEITNPFEVKIMLMQNDRWDNMVGNLKPTFIRDHELVYEFTDEQNEFNGGSEFRNFDLKTIRSRTEHVSQIAVENGSTHVYLTNDDKRTRQRYSFAYDIDGRYIIKDQDGSNADIDGEYCYVHFFLPYGSPEVNGNIYILGQLTDWQMNSLSRMSYDYDRKGYQCTLYLKQGYYNYEYVLLSDGSNVADESVVEGSHYETENDYTIFIYNRYPATTYDRLIGLKRINSARNQ